MPGATIRATTVHHIAIDLALPAAIAWDDIIDTYFEGSGFAAAGCRVEPLADDASAFLGGYRMTMTAAGALDERICRITERDDEAMRLSAHVESLSPGARNMVIYASYHAVPTEGGCRYTIDSHAAIDLDVEGSAAEAVKALSDQWTQGLQQGLDAVKVRLEAA